MSLVKDLEETIATLQNRTQLLNQIATTRINTSQTSSATTFYTDTVTGTIDGVNQTFTVTNTITSALALYLANSIYRPSVDFTTSGTTITMVVAPDSSLSGEPFWLLHT